MPPESSYQLQELTRKVDILDRLARINTVLNSSLKLKPLLSTIMETAAEITNAEAASVLLWDHKTGDLRFAATTAGPQNLIGTSVPLEGSVAGTIFRERRPIRVEDIRNEPRHFKGVDEKVDFHTRSILGVPLISKDRVIGVLEAVNKRVPPWKSDDQPHLEILAAQAAVAIETAQLVGALQKANDELNRLDEMKNEFIAIASHELRTPLSVILGYASFLQETPDATVSANAGKVVESALQLRRIIEDLTNLRYLEHETVDLQTDIVLLDDFLRELMQEPAVLGEAKGHRFELFPPPPNTYVLIDRVRMGMALTNILNNAVRFTHQGGRIAISAEMHTPREMWVMISDNGVGIPADQLERIFEKFYQVEDHMTRTVGGLGIGLSIAKALVEAHGCRIWASSPGVGAGSTFTITMPITDKRATKP
ncbi:MAG: GAF domain-containing sensor histidine kinase [bacterium]|nr:GAF domain-containing sensor histidine kinase [bacterium]